jgi:hypothetical protein
MNNQWYELDKEIEVAGEYPFTYVVTSGDVDGIEVHMARVTSIKSHKIFMTWEADREATDVTEKLTVNSLKYSVKNVLQQEEGENA